MFWVFLFQRQWTVLKLLGIMGCADSRRRSSLLWAQLGFLGAAELYVCTWFSLFTAVWPLQIWYYLKGLLGYVGRGPKQTWWSARKLATRCCKLSCPTSCSIWPGQQNSECHILSSVVREWGTHMEKEGVDLDLLFLPPSAGPCAAGRLLTVEVLGSCPSEMLSPHRIF